MEKQNVLFIGSFQSVSSTGHTGGQMFACHSLIQSALKEKCNFHLLDTTASTNMHRSFSRRLGNGVLRFVGFIRIMLSRDIDTVLAFSSYGYSFLEKGGLLMMAKLLGKRTVIAPRSGFLMDDIDRSKWFRRMAKAVLRRCDYVVCQGNYWKTYFQQQFQIPDDRLPLIHNWIDLGKYPHTGREMRRPLQVLFMGWVEKNKGIFDLIPVMQHFGKEEIQWHIAGKGKGYQAFTTALNQKHLTDRVERYGWVGGRDKIDLLERADVLVVPSYREGLPNVLLEGIASHCAVIASDVGAVADIIRDRENGFLIQPGDSTMIIEALQQYLDTPSLATTHASKAYTTLLETCTVEEAVLKFSRLLCA